MDLDAVPRFAPSWFKDSHERRLEGRTTHGMIWPASTWLLEFLSEERILDDAAASKEGTLKILELGAGTGWMGLNIAHHLGSRAHITITEIGDGMPDLERNCSETCASLSLNNVSTAECDWAYLMGENDARQKEGIQELLATRWDFVVGSDLAWNSVVAVLLPHALSAFITQGQTRVLYAHEPKHNYKAHDLFLETCQTCNLRMTPLHVLVPWAGDEDEPEGEEWDEEASGSWLFPKAKPDTRPQFTIFDVSTSTDTSATIHDL